MPGIAVDSDFPGGNIVVESIVNDTVTLHQDLRGNSEWWFYWNLRVRGAAGRKVRFVFTDGDVFGAMGPCFSPDGKHWRWLGREALDGLSFSYAFPDGMDEAYFSLGVPYTERNLTEFLAGQHRLDQGVLTVSERGRSVESLTQLSRGGEYKMIITCRHHACEAMASYVFEGLLAWLTGGADGARFMQERIDVHAIPFMDKDGVEDGDQGKMRAPHDHWDDYSDSPLYASTRALIGQAASWRGEPVLLLDLHCPALRGGSNDQIFVVEPEPHWMGAMNQFYDLLEREAAQAPAFRRENSIGYGVEWNVAGTNCPAYFRDHHNVLAFTLEFPYALAGGTIVTPDNARAFGAALGRASSIYIQGLIR